MKGTCTNSKTIGRQALEGQVLSGLKDRLLEPDALATFVKAFEAEMKLLVDLRGDLAGILAIASSDKQKPDGLSTVGPELLSQVMVVAGTRNGRDRHSLVVEI